MPAVACLRCGAPVFAEDRFCGACGAPRTPAPTPEPVAGATTETSAYGARLLAMLRSATLGEYEIRGELGRGGMAAVYLAYDLRLNRKVAIKVMLPELAFHEGMEDRFKREARTAAKLDHPNIVVIYSVRDDAELLYFVMKFIEGASLEQLVRKFAPLPLPVAQHVLVQLAHALQYAHDEGVVHRDVKPANVLIDRRGNTLVTDFGIAKATEAPNLTRTGSVIGTPAYMSPEQCMGNDQTHASDQYSLGVLAYELIAGHPPFKGPMIELQWAHVKVDPPPLLDARPDCPPPLASAVMRMLRKDPAERWPSLQDAVSSLSTGLAPGDESPRRKLGEMVRAAAPVPADGIAVTPASPIPQSRGSAPAPRPPVVTAVRIAPLTTPLEVGMTRQMTCEIRDADGREIPGAELDWASSDPSVASVTASGELTALAIGKTTLAATSQSHSATLTIEVVPDRVAEVVLTPSLLTLEERTSARLTVRANNGRGTAIVGRQVALQSADARIATIAPDGMVAGKTVGRTRVTAELEGKTATADIVVRPAAVAAISVSPQAPSTVAGTAVSFAAALRDASGQSLSGRTVAWTSSDPSVLTIDHNGRAVSAKAGTVEVTAECEGMKASVQVTVAPPALTELWVDPPASPVRAGKRSRLHAKARDTTGRELAPDAVVWRSSDPSIATVAADGTLSAVAPGEVSVVATVGTRQASATLTVVAPPPPPRIPVPAFVGLVALVAVVAGVLLFIRNRGPENVVVQPLPADTAVVPSRVTDSAQQQPPSSDSVSGQQPPATNSAKDSALGPASRDVAALRITTRSPILLETSQASRIAVRATTADGSPAPSAAIVWTSRDASIAAVNANGTVTGRAEGRTTLTATAGSATANVEVIVSRPVPATVTIAQRAGSVKVGEQTALAARVRGRAGQVLPDAVVWRSSNPGVATVDNAGIVRGVRQGDAVISALAGGATDSIRVTVTAAAVAANPQTTNPQPATPQPAVTYPPPQPNRPSDERPADRPASSGGTNVATAAEVDAALRSAAQSIADGFSRGQLGLLRATSQFTKTVSDDRPTVVGNLQVQRRSIGDGRADGDVAVPLRWKTFTGGVKNGTVVLRISLEQRGGDWRATAASNLNNP